MKAGQDAVNKGILTNSALGTGIASTLDAMNAAPRCSNARAAIGGVRSYVQRYRNLTHHWPKNNKDAYRKYSDCRHQLRTGLSKFRALGKHCGI